MNMEAWTSSVKRDNPNSPDYIILSKKPRFSYPQEKSRSQTLKIDSSSTVSRLSQYPQGSTSKKWKREVHAPCRTLKFGPLKHRSETVDTSVAKMGNFLARKLDQARKSTFNVLRYFSFAKEVPRVDYSVEDYENLDKLEKGVKYTIEDINDADAEVDAKLVEERSEVTLSDDHARGSGEECIDKFEFHGSDPPDDLGLEAYKRLNDSARMRSERLDALNFEIALQNKKLSAIRLSQPVKDVREEIFVPLTKEEEAEIQLALSSSNRKKILVSHQYTNIDITGEVLQCLKPRAWLNDEIINLYLELLKEREKRKPQNYNKCHFFNTFFFKKLTSGGFNYKAVKRWTTEKKLGYFLIHCEKIFVPIHKEIHWCLAIIDNKEKKFQYLDSLGGKDLLALENLAKYFVEEVKDKSKIDIDVSGWERECPDCLPVQENGYDCGMFMIKYADFGSRGLDFSFSQKDMPYFRLKTAKEILRLSAE